MEHYKSDIEGQEYQINRYQWFNLKPNQENVGSVSKSRKDAVAAEGHDLAVGKVDQPDNREHDSQSEREHGIDLAEADAVDDLLYY